MSRIRYLRRILGGLVVCFTSAASPDSGDFLQQQQSVGKAYTALVNFAADPEKNETLIKQVAKTNQLGPGVIRLMH